MAREDPCVAAALTWFFKCLSGVLWTRPGRLRLPIFLHFIYVYIFCFCASLFISAHAYEISDNMKSGWKEVAQRSVYGLQRVNRAVTIRPPFVQPATCCNCRNCAAECGPPFWGTWGKRLRLLEFHSLVFWTQVSWDFFHRQLRGLGSCLSSFEYQITLPIMRSGYEDPEMYTIKNVKNINMYFFKYLDYLGYQPYGFQVLFELLCFVNFPLISVDF